uniref:Uncharacterized protein n=1 Tax=Lepeophtheirus salmonis TaxID=72036 RepID=A0A0K2U7P6_LEPSM
MWNILNVRHLNLASKREMSFVNQSLRRTNLASLS